MPTLDIVIVASSARGSLVACLQALKQQTYPADSLGIYVVLPDHATVGGATVIVAPASASAGQRRNLAVQAGKGEL
ncbi:MAG: hypothetical protein ACRD3W_31830, partial [Terriglobales bacterium]